MIRALIVDDEKRARELVREMIRLYCPEITEIEEASTVSSAIEAIHGKKPDLVFLDVNLNKGNGFDVLRGAAGLKLNVIFITAYEEYAIKAFKVSALDYLLKPIDPDDFVSAVSRALQLAERGRFMDRVEEVMKSLEAISQGPKKITLKTTDRIHVIAIPDIVFCEADRNYTNFYMTSGEKLMVSKALGEYEEQLPRESFLRVHQSYLVNIEHIRRFDKQTNQLIVGEEKTVPVSTRKREQLLSYFSEL